MADATIQPIRYVTLKKRYILNVLAILFASIIAGGYYAFEYSNNYSDRYYIAVNEFNTKDDILTKTQDTLNQKAEESPLINCNDEIVLTWLNASCTWLKDNLNNIKFIK